jgi:hypothetical protein
MTEGSPIYGVCDIEGWRLNVYADRPATLLGAQ